MRMFRLGVTFLIYSFAVASLTAKELTVFTRSVVVPNPAYDSAALVQFPFNVFRHEFEFYKPDTTDASFYTRVWAQVTVMDSMGLPYDSGLTYFTVGAPSLVAAGDSNVPIFNNINLMLMPGSYSARLEVIDVVSKQSGNAFITGIKVPRIEKQKLTVAATQFAYNIRPASADDSLANLRMIHHGLYVLTNPLSVFTDSDTVMYFYGELYNLGGDGENTIRYRYSSLKEDGSPLFALGNRTQSVHGTQAAFAEQFSIKGWLPGLYILRVVIEASSTLAVDTIDSPFRIISPRQMLSASVEARKVHAYDTMSIERKANLAWWLLTPAERTMLDRLNEQGKESFLRQFWSTRDKVRSTPENEYRDDIIARFNYANQNFSRGLEGRDGWQSDRGRIHIAYGPAEEVDDISVPVTGEAIQVWHYRSIKEGKYFIFEQDTGGLDYKLIHSNVNGEAYSKKWETYYKNSLLQSEDMIDDRPIDHP